MNIGIDMMGGDYAPLEAARGIQLYLSGHNIPANLVLIGDKIQVEKILAELGVPLNNIEVVHKVPVANIKTVHAEQVIGMHEHPTKTLREKPKSSIAIGFQLLASGKMDAFISAGNTGAMLVGALFSIKALDGVIRPTISSIIPKANGGTGLLLDVGLNADCKPEQLNQFAIMGSVYAQLILGIENPKVGLINVGEEEGKGNLLAQSTYPLLKENKHINFIGNIEGHIILKMAESLYEISHTKKVKEEYFERFNFENYGGTPVLGVAKPVIIGHGISGAKAFMNMIHLAQVMIEKDVMQKMKEELS